MFNGTNAWQIGPLGQDSSVSGTLPAGSEVSIVAVGNPYLEAIYLSGLASYNATVIIEDNAICEFVDLPDLSVADTLQVEGNTRLFNLTAPALTTANGPIVISGNNGLSAVDFPALTIARSSVTIEGNIHKQVRPKRSV